MNKLYNISILLLVLLMQQAQAGVTFIHTDILGSPTAETNTSGQVLSLSHYQSFGKEIEQSTDDVAYTGHKYDADLGLSYMQARYYDPVIGRFYSNDPVDAVSHLSNEEGIRGFNRYSYAVNNPYKYTDPDGKAICGGVCVAGAVIGVARLSAMAYRAYKTYRVGAVAAGVTTAVVLNESLNSDSGISGAVDLVDDLAGQEVVGEIEAGEGKVLEGMGDDKFDPETGTHDKVVKNRTNADGTKTEVHTERNRDTQKVDKAKIKQDGKHSRENNQ